MNIALPVKLHDAVGQTHNISASGIYVTFHRAAVERVEPGAAIALEMLFEHANPEGPLMVVCEGEIVRVDPRDDQVGLAARITSYRFISAEQTRFTSAEQTAPEIVVPRLRERGHDPASAAPAGGEGGGAKGNG